MPRPIHLSIELLETFITLVRHDGDAAQAGRVLNINQPSISKRLAFLQTAGPLLDRPWLRREGKTWVVTDEGRRVLPVVHELLDRYSLLTRYTNAPRPAHGNVIRLACGQTAAARLLPRVLEDFKKSHPDAQVRISTMRAPQRVIAVASGAVDMALVSRDDDEIRELSRGTPLEVHEVARFGYCLVCDHDSQWAAEFEKLPRSKPIPLEAISRFPLIVPEPDSHTRQVLDPILHREPWGNRVDFRIQIGGWNAILDYTRAGHGVGLVSEAVLPPRHPDGLLVRKIAASPLLPQIIKLIMLADADTPAAARAEMLRVCRAHFRASGL